MAAGDPPMHVEWVDTESGWESLREIWDERLERSERPSLFATWDFLDLSWRHFARPNGDDLAVFVIRCGDEPVGFAPLRLSKRRRLGWPRRRLAFLASWEADRPPFVVPREEAASCVEAVLDFLESAGARRWNELDLHEVDADGPLARALREWVAQSGKRRLAEAEDSASAVVRLEGSWESFLSRLDRNFRRNVKRRFRRLEARGAYELVVHEDPSEMGEALDAYLELERRSWKARAGQGIGRSPRLESFYRELLERLSRKGRVVVSLLQQGGRPLAGTIEYRLGTSVYGAQTCFDEAEARLSPGTLVKALSIRRHLVLGVREFELLGGFLEDKRRWTAEILPRRRMRLRVGRS